MRTSKEKKKKVTRVTLRKWHNLKLLNSSLKELSTDLTFRTGHEQLSPGWKLKVLCLFDPIVYPWPPPFPLFILQAKMGMKFSSERITLSQTKIKYYLISNKVIIISLFHITYQNKSKSCFISQWKSKNPYIEPHEITTIKPMKRIETTATSYQETQCDKSAL